MSEAQLLRNYLCSSVLFLFGSTLWTTSLFFTVREDLATQIVTYLAYALLLLHAFVEAHVDIHYSRTEIHSRYGHGSILNLIHSFLFGVGALLEAASFFLSDDSDGSDDHWYSGFYLWTDLAAAHCFVLTSLLSLYGRQCCVPGAGLDNNANTMYTCGAILMLTSGYEVFFGNGTDVPFFTKWLGVLLWTVAGVLYMGRDSLKWKRPSTKELKQPLHAKRAKRPSQKVRKERSSRKVQNEPIFEDPFRLLP
jgi:hypothetical protein